MNFLISKKSLNIRDVPCRAVPGFPVPAYPLTMRVHLGLSEKKKREKADIMKNETINGETIQYISGDVIFSKGALTLKCQNGTNNQDSGIATLFDSVSSIQNNRNLTCDTLLFYSKENKILSFGNPHLWDKNYDLF